MHEIKPTKQAFRFQVDNLDQFAFDTCKEKEVAFIFSFTFGVLLLSSLFSFLH